MGNLKSAIAVGAVLACMAAGCTMHNDAYCADPVPELCDDGIDNDCDRLIDYDDAADCEIACTDDCPPICDADEDGALAQGCGGADCNDHNSAVYPGHPEICSDGVDNNCDGATDAQDALCQNACEAAGPVSIEVALVGADSITVCDSPCESLGASWTLYNAAGEYLARRTSCDVDCATCEWRPCASAGAACKAPEVATISSPVRFSWDGKVVQKSTCGDETACTQRVCAPAGQYTVKVCVDLAPPGQLPGATCESSKSVCAEIEFDYPAAAVIQGKLQIPQGADKPNAG